jgi:hypothetical protein
MKKTTTKKPDIKKLALKRESLRDLTAKQLEDVAGASWLCGVTRRSHCICW